MKMPVHDDDIVAVHARLIADRLIEPVSGDDERLWSDCDLASLAENRLGDLRDPRHVDDATRAAWIANATTEPPHSPVRRSYERCYWLRDGERRAGTLCLGTTITGAGVVRLSSLYVLPADRGRGMGRRAIERVRAALAAHDLGLRLETSWLWQPTVRFYLRLGARVRMWKREIDLWWPADGVAWEAQVSEHQAALVAVTGGNRRELALAERRGETLILREAGSDEHDERAAADTLSLALAAHGWPLVRSPEDWEHGRFGDCGSPESLAYKIVIWEAWAKKHGWRVQTPRIPGLAYPTWEELEASWR